MSNSSRNATSTWRLAAILNFVKKNMFRSGESLGLFTCNKGGHYEHFLKFSALYYFLPFQNLKFLDYELGQKSRKKMKERGEKQEKNKTTINTRTKGKKEEAMIKQQHN